MRKIFTSLLAVFLVVFLVGCASKKVESSSADTTTNETVAKETKAETAKIETTKTKAEAKAETEKVEAVEPATAPTSLEVIDAVIATSVDNLTPAGAGTEFTKDTPKVYCFSKITGAENETAVKHKWYRNNELATEIELPVKASSWRTYSYKTLVPELAGSWKVDITDKDGKVLKSLNFEVK